MTHTHNQSPLIVITGPTASGKSSLALALAKKWHGEIICADSRTVYRGMDIGTAKPSRQDRDQVPHHLLDVVEPGETFTAAAFQQMASQAIVSIRARGAIPFVVGGTGLYIDGLILGYRFGSAANTAIRDSLEDMTVSELHSLLESQRIVLPRNRLNKRHLVRAYEQAGVNNNREKMLNTTTIVVAIATDKQELDTRIRERADTMFAGGIIEEARSLADRFGWDSEAMTGNIYPLVRRLIDGEITLNEAKELFIIKDRQLAKKQITWLKRHDFVNWMSLKEAQRYLEEILALYANTTH